jgi:hypothetical protein
MHPLAQTVLVAADAMPVESAEMKNGKASRAKRHVRTFSGLLRPEERLTGIVSARGSGKPEAESAYGRD